MFGLNVFLIFRSNGFDCLFCSKLNFVSLGFEFVLKSTKPMCSLIAFWRIEDTIVSQSRYSKFDVKRIVLSLYMSNHSKNNVIHSVKTPYIIDKQYDN